MAEKKKKPMENMPQKVKPKHAIPAQLGKDMMEGLAGALSGVIETMNGGKTVVKKGKGK